MNNKSIRKIIRENAGSAFLMNDSVWMQLREKYSNKKKYNFFVLSDKIYFDSNVISTPSDVAMRDVLLKPYTNIIELKN